MKRFKTLIVETFDILDAHRECAEAGVPLPDKPLDNLRKFHNGWRYDTENGYIEHNTTAHGSREPGAGYVSHYSKTHRHHRDGNLPAVVHSTGAKIWFKEGKRVATYLPADPKHGYTEDSFFDSEDLGTGKSIKISRDAFASKYAGL